MATREEIIAGLADIFEECSGVKPSDVTEDKTIARDLDVDSLSLVEAVVMAEERFKISIPDEHFNDLVTVADFVSLIEKLTAP